MLSRFGQFFVFAAALLLAVGGASAQVATSGRLTGVVTDATQAAVPGASITVVDDATGATITTQSGADGTFTVGNLKPATYTVRVTSQGFKTSEYRNVKITVGETYTLNSGLEVGEVQSTVTVEAGAEVLKTSETAVATTVTGKAIQQLPFTSRDAMDLGTLMPGAQTTGRVRNTSFMGLPKGAINITFDGINAQDNINKSSDGFFTTIRPRVDSVEEFSISTAGQGAEQSGEGAVQIRFETKRGSNEFHGGAWWYHRNDWLNANYYFNNRDGRPRDRLRLNQFGYSVGGPVWKDKLFFFHAFDFYRKPDSRSRPRTVLTPEAASGRFRYAVSSVSGALPAWVTCNAPAGSAGQCVADLYALAAANALPSTPDSVIGPLVQDIADMINVSGVGVAATQPNLFQNSVTFTNFGVGNRYFPDFRFDWNITNNHQFSAIYHYSKFVGTPDFLNSRDFTYPVAPFDTNQASQNSDRNAFTGQWRWNLSPNKSNMFIFGVVSAPVAFFNDMSPAIYPQITTNLGSIRARPLIFGFSTAPWLPFGAFPRNTALGQINDTFSWTKGKHSMSFGFSATAIYGGIQSSDSAVASVRMDGLAPTDPANGVFSTGNMPGISTTQRNNARNLYATLTGRIGRSAAGADTYSGFVYVDINSRQFVTGVPLQENYRQNEFGFFGTDNWRVTPTLSLNYGMRWEYQGSPYGTDNIYFNLIGGEAGVFGVSGNGNLFAPGTLTGQAPVYRLNGNSGWYNRDLNNFAPSIGLAWTPNLDTGWYRFLFGGPSKAVFRGAYSISYTREGTGNWLSMTEGNPGFFGLQRAIAGSDFTAGSLLFQNGTISGVRQSPSAFVNSFATTSGDAVNSFAQNLRVPYVQSWSFGIQRELTPDTVLEVRYVGNHAPNLWRQQDLNEVNIFENGFLNEFLAAQSNLALCQAAGAGCPVANSFENQGLAGQVALPIMEAAFGGPGAGEFIDGALGVTLAEGQVGDLASILAFDPFYFGNLFAATNPVTGSLYPTNFWITNPDAIGGAFLMKNGAHSTYHGLQVEVRRRMAQGLQFNANYTWSHSLTNLFAVSGASFDQLSTVRSFRYDKSPSPFDFRHAFKFQGIWELPFGPGKRWSSEHGWMNKVIGGWEVSALARWQSGRVTQLTGGLGGTVNGNDGGIEFLGGFTPKQLQKMAKVRQTTGGTVFYFPDSVIDPTSGTANFSMMRPCQTPGQFCQRVFVYGPSFFKPDINIVKRTYITEQVNVEFRVEFLNAFNNINFLYGGNEAAGVASQSISSTSFGQIPAGGAFRDVSTTDDPGGRSIQLVLRINF